MNGSIHNEGKKKAVNEKDNNGRKILYLSRHLIAGRSQVVQCEIGVMTPDDYDEAVKLHGRVAQGMSRELFVPTSEEDIMRLLDRDGISLGVWFEDRLICMRAIVTNGEWMDEILTDMGLVTDPERKSVYTEHCIVDKDFRGNNTQFLTHYAIENIITDRYETFYTTVSPQNSFSLQNVLGCNFVVVGIRKMYGGYQRYILRKVLSRGMPIWTHGHLIIPVHEAEHQAAAIADGYVGYKLIRKSRRFSVLYAPAGDNPPKGYWRNIAE